MFCVVKQDGIRTRILDVSIKPLTLSST